MPSAFAMARLLSEGVGWGDRGRRAWPPRRSSNDRMAERMWVSMLDMMMVFFLD